MDANDDVQHRLERIYAAIGETIARGPERLRPTIVPDGRGFRITFDGGLTQLQQENVAMYAVFHVAHLRDHLKKWAKVHGADPEQVETAVSSSRSAQVVIDLANRDKHGGPGRDGGLSGLAPRISRFRGVLRLTGGSSEPGITFRLSPIPGGLPQIQGDVSAVITGEVVDRNGGPIGELHDLVREALAVFEGVLASWRSAPITTV